MSEILNKLTEFVERLKELMFERNITPKELANKLEIDYSNVMRYFRKEILPNYKSFLKMLYFFECTADYLLCLEDYNVKRERKVAPPFSERLKNMLKEKQMTKYRLTELTGYSYYIVNAWLSGRVSPYLDNLIKLAEVFNCTVEYLIFGEE